MFHITIKPDTFTIDQKYANQNPYYTSNVNHKLALEQHKGLVKQLSTNINYAIKKPDENISQIPDIVFVANGGLSLPRLPESLVILPWMKFEQRRNELKYLKEIYEDLRIKTVEFPGSVKAPYEGAAESKWFNNGEILVMGYGYRASKESVNIMRILLTNIYLSYGVNPPLVIAFRLQSFDYYHLDIAMLEISQNECIIQKDAIKAKDLTKLKEHINVHVIENEDKFCLNSIIDGENLITHILTKSTRKLLENLTGKSVIECDVSEFEKSGGSVRCMILDIFDNRAIKRKKQGNSPSSPK